MLYLELLRFYKSDVTCSGQTDLAQHFGSTREFRKFVDLKLLYVRIFCVIISLINSCICCLSEIVERDVFVGEI